MATPGERPAPVHAEMRDLDGDGQDEVILDNGHLRLVLAPADGGRLRAWTVRTADGHTPNSPGRSRRFGLASAPPRRVGWWITSCLYPVASANSRRARCANWAMRPTARLLRCSTTSAGDGTWQCSVRPG
jgi:hypothetical protein